MAARARWALLVCVLVVLVGLGFLLKAERLSLAEGGGNAGPIEPGGTGGGATAVAGRRAPATAETLHSAGEVPARPGGVKVLATLGWGAGPDQLGRDRPREGNPEAPMSFAVDKAGNLWVLDQVNERLMRLDKEGRPLGTFPVPQRGPQDIAVGQDGTVLVMDRLADKSVAVLDAEGRIRGDLPLPGKGIPEPGLVTGVLTDGMDVYVEREHGPLVRIGDLAGNPDSDRPEVPGRPTRDGQSYISAGLIDGPNGRLYLNSVVRATRERRYTRVLTFAFPVTAIVLLDTDARGTIYLGLVTHSPGADEATGPEVVKVFCLDPLDAHSLGQTEVPSNQMPEETFRTFAVLDQGGFLYTHYTERGVELLTGNCR